MTPLRNQHQMRMNLTRLYLLDAADAKRIRSPRAHLHYRRINPLRVFHFEVGNSVKENAL